MENRLIELYSVITTDTGFSSIELADSLENQLLGKERTYAGFQDIKAFIKMLLEADKTDADDFFSKITDEMPEVLEDTERGFYPHISEEEIPF